MKTPLNPCKSHEVEQGGN